MNDKLKNRKVLLLGADTSTGDALEYFKKRGCYTIVTDYNPPDVMAEKRMSDEYWMIDVADTNALEKACREKGITNIYAGNHEFCLDQCKELCKRLNLPFYASELGWRASRDKEYYKELCKEEGLRVPEQYKVDSSFNEADLLKIKYPVIVKPNDGNGRRGVYVANDKNELKEAFLKALPFSQQRKILVEDYIPGDDIFVFAYVHQGEMSLLDSFISRNIYIDGEKRFGFFDHDKRFTAAVEKQTLAAYKRLARKLGCQNGICLFQGIYKDGLIYNTELGFRLDGMRIWRRTALMRGINYLELMINLCLGEENTDILDGRKPALDSLSLGYTLWGKPGRIAEITGKDVLYDRDDIIVLWDRFKQQDIIPDVSDMRAIVLAIEVFGDSYEDIKRKIMAINCSLSVRNQSGMDLLEYRVPAWK